MAVGLWSFWGLVRARGQSKAKECCFGCTQTKILVRSKWAVYQRATLPKLPREGLYSLFRMWYRKVQIRLFTVCWEGHNDLSSVLGRLCHMGRVNWWTTMGESPLNFSSQNEGRWWSWQFRHKAGCEEKIKASIPVTTSWSRTEDQPVSKIWWLQSLNAKTGLFSKRMKIIHRDPMLHAQRVAAIKKAKGTAAARKRASEALKVFFSDPENRRKRSIAMKGVKFYCRHCGREGHRRHYCPELKSILINRQFVCGICGEKGHNRRTCPKSRLSSHKSAVRRLHHCKICGQRGHNSRTCPKLIGVKSSVDIKKGFHSSGRRGAYKCKLCQQNGHNSRTCPNKIVSSWKIGHQSEPRNNFLPYQTNPKNEIGYASAVWSLNWHPAIKIDNTKEDSELTTMTNWFDLT